jgi:hypothetical protein
MNRRISTSNIPNITLEVLHIHGIEPDNRHEQTDINLGQHIPEPVWARVAGKVLLGAVEGFEEGGDVALVGIGFGGEAGLVDAVVDEVVDPAVGFFDFGAEVGGVEIDLPVLLFDEVVELFDSSQPSGAR